MRTFTAELIGGLLAGATAGAFVIGLMGRFTIYVLERAGWSPSLFLGLSFLEFVLVAAIMGLMMGFLYPFLVLRVPKPLKMLVIAVGSYSGAAYMLSNFSVMVMDNIDAYWPTVLGFAVVFVVFASLFLRLQDFAATAFSPSGTA